MSYIVSVTQRHDRKPPWLKVKAPGGESYNRIKGTLRRLSLHTVCEEARCPNVGECWREGTATVMLLGDTCTRNCRFCGVSSARPNGIVDTKEPENVARAVVDLGLRYVVLTMVTRDDLEDGGAGHVAETIRRIRARDSRLRIEALVGDFVGNFDAVDTVLASEPDVFAHNLEVVRRMTRRVRDARCSYERSLSVLRHVKATVPSGLTKSSLMVGAGETDDEVVGALRDLRTAGVDVVTLGQYLRPTDCHLPVDRYVTPEQFASFERTARDLAFEFVVSGPLVRSSYRAAELFVEARGAHPDRGSSRTIGASRKSC